MRTSLAGVVFLATAATAALVYHSSIERIETCTVANVMPGPPSIDADAKITRLAWPSLPEDGVLFNTLPSLNNVDSEGYFEPICMNCESPPCPSWEGSCTTETCEGIFRCSPENTWWSITYQNLILKRGERLTIQGGDPIPSDLAVLYEPYYPVPSPTSTALPTPLSTQAPLQPRCPKTIQHLYPLMNATDVDPACGDRTTNVVMAVFLGMFTAIFLVAGSMYCENRCKAPKVRCPYCETYVENLRVHLNTCDLHLQQFTPASLEQVIIENID
jgi:hypothetical protein